MDNEKRKNIIEKALNDINLVNKFNYAFDQAWKPSFFIFIIMYLFILTVSTYFCFELDDIYILLMGLICSIVIPWIIGAIIIYAVVSNSRTGELKMPPGDLKERASKLLYMSAETKKISNKQLKFFSHLCTMAIVVMMCIALIGFHHWEDFGIIGTGVLLGILYLFFYWVSRFLFFILNSYLSHVLHKKIGKFETLYQYTNSSLIEVIDNIKSEERQKIEEEKRRREEEQRIAAANEAEKAFLSLENPQQHTRRVKALADQGSPSACICVVKMLFGETVDPSYTTAEKKESAKDMKNYLQKIPYSNRNVEIKFMLLYSQVMTETLVVDEWRKVLKSARDLKKYGELSEEYGGYLNALIQVLVEHIDEKEREEVEREREIEVLKNRIVADMLERERQEKLAAEAKRKKEDDEWWDMMYMNPIDTDGI